MSLVLNIIEAVQKLRYTIVPAPPKLVQNTGFIPFPDFVSS